MKFEQNMRQTMKQTQKLAMTQELQQSIQMLQYNTDELLTFLENKSLENPLIEIENQTDEIELAAYRKKTNYDSSERDWMEQLPDNTLSLFEHLINQVHLNYRDTYLRQLVLYLIEFIDLNGYLSESIESIQKGLDATEIELLDALTLVQLLEPAGVGARDLRECLMLQIERDDEAPNLAYAVVEEFFEELANRKWHIIEKAYQIDLWEIQKIFDYIKRLHPYPGAGFTEDTDNYIIPDIIVNVKEHELEVLTTKSSTPKLIFQQTYFDKMSQSDDKEVKDYLKNRKSEFDWLKKSMLQRGNTILRVAKAIVNHQEAFFYDSSRPLKSLQLKEIANELSIHESTVSRSVNGKYLQTDFGVFELRTFFRNGIFQLGKEENLSTDLIKKEIQQLVKEENKQKPLSDQKIVELLKKKSITISRRTVAKYRDELSIASSSKRKRYDS